MGGAKGGCDFDPKGRSDNEIRRFCYVCGQPETCGTRLDTTTGLYARARPPHWPRY